MNWQDRIYESLTETRASKRTKASGKAWRKRREGESVEAHQHRINPKGGWDNPPEPLKKDSLNTTKPRSGASRAEYERDVEGRK